MIGGNKRGGEFFVHDDAVTMIEVRELEVLWGVSKRRKLYIQVLVFHLRRLLCSFYSQYPCRMDPLFSIEILWVHERIKLVRPITTRCLWMPQWYAPCFHPIFFSLPKRLLFLKGTFFVETRIPFTISIYPFTD